MDKFFAKRLATVFYGDYQEVRRKTRAHFASVRV